MANSYRSLNEIDEWYGYPCGRPEDLCRSLGATSVPVLVQINVAMEGRDSSRGWGNKMVGDSMYNRQVQKSDVA